MNIFIIALFISVTSCQDKYPDLEDGIYAEFITNKGTMVAKLYYERAPVTVANFVALAEGTHPNVVDSLKGVPYYNGVTFHRVMDKFMIQGGDRTATGSGSPGYRFADEFHPELRHNKPGILSMGNTGYVDTNGSQFFITEDAKSFLDAYDAQGNTKDCSNPRTGCHSVFGELVIGLEVQDSISNVKVNGQNKPLEDVVINELNIIRKGNSAKAFDAPKTYTEELPKIKERKQKLKEEAEAKLKEEAKLAAENFLKNNADLGTNIEKFPTGMVMIRTYESNGTKPNSTQKALINCAGYFEDGKLFYTNIEEVAKQNGQFNEGTASQGGYKPFAMIYNETALLVAGFREVMLNMNVGDKVRVFIPSYLGYGQQGRQPLIPPNTNLVFDLEITGIE